MDTYGSTPGGAIRSDVVVIGDGPAGSALAAAVHRRGLDVTLVGPDRPWTATYSAWTDEIDRSELLEGHDVVAFRTPRVGVRAATLRSLDRPYGVLDNDLLRRRLRHGLAHERREVQRSEDVDAAIVIDATGWPSKLDTVGPVRDTSWQVAFGAVLAEPPSGPLGSPMFMDFSDPYAASGIGDDLDVVTFAYAFPVSGGWLVEETVLVGPDMAPTDLCGRLAARLGTSADELAAASVATEHVRIPMGAPMSRPGAPTPYGATAGMVHPATGYSIATSIGAAPRVAAAIEQALAGPPTRIADTVHAAVWPDPLQRTRRLHEYGLDVLTRLDAAGTRDFFETFFSLDLEDQAAYLRVDTPPTRLAGVMARMFADASWTLRRRLVGADPSALLRVLRPGPAR